MKDLGSKSVLDAFTCVECGRCQVNCPAWGAGKELNPKTIILQTQDALLAGKRETQLGEIYSEKVLWQCTTCGACENQCPVGIEHPADHHRQRAAGWCRTATRPRVSGAMSNHLERRSNIWGLELRSAAEVRRRRAQLEIFDPAKHDVPGLARLRRCRSTPTSRSRCVRCSRSSAREQVKFGVLSKETLHRRSRASAPATSTCSRSWPTPTSKI